MSKLTYFLTVIMMAFSLNAYAQDVVECPEGQTYDEELGICIETVIETEAPAKEMMEE